jgi:DNA gyrase/topoisomerase IV subunit B
VFTPELIKEGKIYKAMPPLYLMDLRSLRKFHSGREWLYDKQEYYAMIHNIIASNTEIVLETDDRSNGTRLPKVKPMSTREALDWLNMNSEYKLELDNLGKKAACEPRILELVCYYKRLYPKPMDFKRKIEEAYPEMSYEINTYSLVGAWEGDYFSLICDTLFDKSAARFNKELMNNKYIYVWYRNKKDPNDKFRRVTVGEFFDDVDKIFNVKIDQRFKGLGEADAELLFRTSTNPKFRKLLRIDIKDAKRASEVFELLHGKSAKLREDRRALIDNFKLSYADIDN